VTNATELDPRIGKRIAAYAMSHLVGTPYVHQGRRPGKHGGIDCFGVLIAAAIEFRLDYFDFRDYDRDVDGTQIEERLSRFCTEVRIKEMRDGDIVLFYIDDYRNPQHFGIVVDDATKFVHARERAAGPSLVKALPFDGADGYWRDRILSVWRYRGWQPS
jgi:cell wall-associated NlpC family hydrolase